jgi:methionyl aminopeptidase
MFIKIHKKEDFLSMYKAGQLGRQTLDFIEPYIKPGVTTNELNNLCHDFIISNNAIPAPLNYKGFPKSICTSLNDVCCHGIPSNDTVLKDGDLLGLDVTVILDGWHGDTSRTFIVGTCSEVNQKLLNVGYEALWEGIKNCKEGTNLGTMANAVESLSLKNGYNVVKEFGGHGIGKIFHSDPYVPFVGKKNTGIMLKAGMFITIEPIINMGSNKIYIEKDKWTVRTVDKSMSIQFEHTIGITKNGPVVFTLNEKEKILFPDFIFHEDKIIF